MLTIFTFVLGLATAFIFSLGIFSLHLRFSHENEDLRAWHVFLPGNVSVFSPEHRIDLKQWAGSRSGSILVKNMDGTTNAEIEASIALRLSGFATSEHRLKLEDDGHYVLHKPQTERKIFTWKAPYRISPWTSK